MLNLSVLVFVVLVLGAVSNAAPCEYILSMEAGITYQFNTPGYSGNYPAYTNCNWKMYAPPGYKIKLDCPVMIIPNQDRIVLNLYGSSNPYDPYNTPVAGTGSLTLSSYTNALNIQLNSTTSSGRFYCTVITQNDPCACGRRQSARITGGTETGVNEIPSQALITDKSYNPVCGGAIISQKTVLTAAHCLTGRTTGNTQAVLGEHDRSTPTETPYTRVYALARMKIHENYNPATNENDIGFVQTTVEITWNFGIGIACLPFSYSTSLFNGISVTLAGWGTSEFGGPLSKKLMKTEATVITNNVCKNTYSQAVSNNFMCTYTPGHDTCQFDSGTSAFASINGRMHSVGVTSGGKGCGTVPALNTRVTQYLNWITTNTPDETYCSVV